MEEVWEKELMAGVGDNKRDMVEVAQMMETLLFGLLEPDFLSERSPRLEGILTWAIEGLTFSSKDILSPYSSPLVRIRISVFDPAAAMWTALPITLVSYNWFYMATVVAGTDI